MVVTRSFECVYTWQHHQPRRVMGKPDRIARQTRVYSPASSKVTLRKDRTSSSLSVVLAPAVYKERTERDRRAPAPPAGTTARVHAATIQPGCKENAATTTTATATAAEGPLPRASTPSLKPVPPPASPLSQVSQACDRQHSRRG